MLGDALIYGIQVERGEWGGDEVFGVEKLRKLRSESPGL